MAKSLIPWPSCPKCGRPSKRRESTFCSNACVRAVASDRQAAKLSERIWARIQKGSENECWPYLGRICPDGYGAICYRSKNIAAHRAVWIAVNGPIPEGLIIRHHCDNRRCCNPSHLAIGTTKDNVRDRVTRNRSASGAKHPMAKLTPTDAKEILASSEPQRVLAARFGVGQATIWRVRHGLVWSATTTEAQ